MDVLALPGVCQQAPSHLPACAPPSACRSPSPALYLQLQLTLWAITECGHCPRCGVLPTPVHPAGAHRTLVFRKAFLKRVPFASLAAELLEDVECLLLNEPTCYFSAG